MATIIEVQNFQQALHEHIRPKRLERREWIFADSPMKIMGLNSHYEGTIFVVPSQRMEQELLIRGLRSNPDDTRL